MSSVPIPLPRKVSDDQYVGDLMSLFERRRVKCGDSQALERFASELGSNNALRGDLFALCTAISHMAAEDLSGEQLLVLVARALAGPASPKGAPAAEIPESMRTAFLSGYDSWSKRGSMIEEDLPWPPARRAAPQEQAAPPAEARQVPAGDNSQSGPVDGQRTIQEALHIARERSANGLAASWSAIAGIEHLTIGELKKLLEEIEHRAGRIDTQAAPKLRDDEPGRNDWARDGVRAAAEDAESMRSHRGAVLPFESGSRGIAPEAGTRPEPATRGAPAEVRVDDPFLSRHTYLKPRPRPARAADAEAAPASPASASADLADAGEAAPEAVSASSIVAANSAVAAPAAACAGNAVATAVPSPAISPAGAEFDGKAVYGEAARQVALGQVIKPSQSAPLEPLLDGRQDSHIRVRISLRALTVLLCLVATGSVAAGIFVYQSMHPKTIEDFPDLRTMVPADGASRAASAARDPGGDVQLIVAGPDDSLLDLNSADKGRSGTDAGSRTKTPQVAQTGPPVSVWPPGNAQGLGQAASQRRAATTPRRAPAETAAGGVLRVPSTTMMQYALTTPTPAYPANQPTGMTGTVVVAIEVSREGNVTGAWAVSGPDELRSAALQAVQGWRFRPYLVDGAPAEVTTTLGFFFNGR